MARVNDDTVFAGTPPVNIPSNPEIDDFPAEEIREMMTLNNALASAYTNSGSELDNSCLLGEMQQAWQRPGAGDLPEHHASPEPESSFDKSVSGSDFFDNSFEKSKTDGEFQHCCDDKVKKLKRQHDILIASTSSLGVALIASIVGIVMLAFYLRNANKLPIADAAVLNVSNISLLKIAPIDDPWHTYEFPTINSSDSEIASAFADHSMYQTFYGVTYDGPGLYFDDANPKSPAGISANDKKKSKGTKNKRNIESNSNTTTATSYELQHQISLDMALLARVTTRVRIYYDRNNRLVERAIQAVLDLNLNISLYLSLPASTWAHNEYGLREVINSAPKSLIKGVYIEQNTEYDTAYMAKNELDAFLKRNNQQDIIESSIIIPQKLQANPLDLTTDPTVACNWINADTQRRVYTNLETPSETSVKARYMTEWVCNVVPYLRHDIEWFWANAFDNGKQVTNGIFTQNRKMKPAGLPRCMHVSE